MREKYIWVAVGLLALLTLGRACYMYEQKAAATEIDRQPPVRPEISKMGHAQKAFDAQQEELDKWRAKVREQIDQGFALGDRDFDEFFNDRYFSGSANPFAEMDRIHGELSRNLRDAEKTLFEGYWNTWFERRMRMRQFPAEVKRTARDITLTIRIPGLSAGTADVNISGERIKISFSARAQAEEKREGLVTKTESSQSFIKILPVPEDAAAGTGKAVIDGELVKITFARK